MDNHFIFLIILFISGNLWGYCLRVIYNDTGKFYQHIAPIVGIYGVYYFFQGVTIFYSAHDWLYWLLLLALVSYSNICLSNKKYLKFSAYVILFCAESVAFICEVTALFGEYYYNDLYQFVPTVENLLELQATSITPYVAFLKIGAEHYFITPDTISLYNPHFVQFYFGKTIIAGVILSGVYEILKKSIWPRKKVL